MLQIKGKEIKRADKKLLRYFCQYVLDKYVSASVQAESTIIIKFLHDTDLHDPDDRREFKEYWAWSEYDGIQNKKRHFTITISYKTISKAKSQIRKFKATLETIGHELIHIKQYLNNELFDYKNGDVRYKGKVFKDWQKGEEYYFSPWEIEAYGHETGLYKCFKQKLKEEAKAK